MSDLKFKPSRLDHRVVYQDLAATRTSSSGFRAITIGWSVDGRRLAAGSNDGVITLWTFSAATPKRIWEPRMKGEITRVQWSPYNVDYFAASSLDKTVQLFDAKLGKVVGTIETGHENIFLAYAPPHVESGHPQLAILRKDDVIAVYDTVTLTKTSELRPKQGYTDEVNDIEFSKEGDLLFITTSDGTLKVYSWPDQQRLHTFQTGSTPLFSCDFDPMGRYFAMGSGDALCSLWDAHDFLPIKTFSQLNGAVRSISFSYDGEYVCIASEQDKPHIIHVAGGKTVAALTTGLKYVNNVAWHPTSLMVACIGAGNHVRLFTLEDPQTPAAPTAAVNTSTVRPAATATSTATPATSHFTSSSQYHTYSRPSGHPIHASGTVTLSYT